MNHISNLCCCCKPKPLLQNAIQNESGIEKKVDEKRKEIPTEMIQNSGSEKNETVSETLKPESLKEMEDFARQLDEIVNRKLNS